jgi:hypothetical protein
MIERLHWGSSIYVHHGEHPLSTNIRRHALNLMINKGASGSAFPSATDMMVLSALKVCMPTR